MDSTGLLIIVLILAVVGLWLFAPSPPEAPSGPPAATSPPPPPSSPYTAPNLTLAAWNLQIWGPAKASQPGLVARVAHTLDAFDIIVVQEIRDDSEGHDAFSALCQALPRHRCALSSRAGRTQVKEQYGLLYRDTLTLTAWEDLNPDPLDRWERPPIKTTWNLSGYVLTLYALHAKPTAVAAELSLLEARINDSGNIVVMGDLNAACLYYTPDQDSSFDTWFWAIRDDQRTNLAAEGCAYDRILLNADAAKDYVAAGITTTNINDSVSDHYPTWVTLRPTDEP